MLNIHFLSHWPRIHLKSWTNINIEFFGVVVIIKIYLSNRNGKISKPIKNCYGVMQGGVLSLKLFNEFLQDLGKYLNPKYGLKIGDIYLAYLLFADDIVLFSEFAESLHAQIDLFYK